MKKKKILLIEDEKDMVYAMTMRLKAAGCEVITAYDGREGLKKAKKEKPDLIILDLMLPKMDGYKVCGLFKSDKRYNKIPIVIFTARAQQADIKMSKEMGADAYITKPFNTKILLSKIKELLKD
jgi:DNA-binding response OmpR family regulator